MNDLVMPDSYARLIEPATLEIQRIMPGPIERIWAYLTESDLRRQWLASGAMDLLPGSDFELVWRNDELTDPPGKRPAGMDEEHRMVCRLVEADPPHRLVFEFGPHGEVTFTLEPAGGRVLLTLIQRRIPTRKTMLSVSAGWHAHLDLLVARASGVTPKPFWDGREALLAEYDRRLPA